MGYYTRDELRNIESKIMKTSTFKFLVDEQRKINREYIGMTLENEDLEYKYYEVVTNFTFEGQKLNLYFDGPMRRELIKKLNILRVADGSILRPCDVHF